MSAAAVALLLGIAVAVLVLARGANVVAAVVCVLFGLVLATTETGVAVYEAVRSAGQWIAAFLGGL